MTRYAAKPARHRLALAVYALVSAWAMASLHSALVFQHTFKRPGSARVAVRTAVKPVSVPAVTPHSDAILPLKTATAAPQKSTPKPSRPSSVVAPTPVAPPAAQDPPVAPPSLPTLEQPSLAAPGPTGTTQTLPPLATSEVPPMPGAQPSMPNFALAAVEKPGGEVLVLALLINDLGVVEETSIIVPSRYALGDVSMALSYRGQKWVQLDPPMMPGERRWLELRIDHAGKDPARGDNLP